MKLLFKLFSSIFVILAIGVGVIYFAVFGPTERDQLNPFLEEESRYFIVKTDGIPYGSENMERYKYEIIAYNEQLQPEKLTLTAGIILRHNAVIEVTSKGQHVETWQEVQLEDLSDKLRNKIQNF